MLGPIVKPLGYCFVVLFSGIGITSQAQSLGISVEGSFQAFASEIKEDSDIRVDPMQSFQGYPTFDAYSTTSSNVMSSGGGVLVERFSPNEHWSLATGLQYRVISTHISAAETQYFFYRYAQEGLDTRYLRINSITQNISCIGIPLQIRFFPFGGRRARFYAKVSLENNFNVSASGHVRFFQAEMDPYEKQVQQSFEQPLSYNAIMSLAGGVRFHGQGKFAGGFEVIGPTGFLTPNAIGMVSPTVGMGLQFNVVYLFKKSNDD
jgi:hypothetical protein